MEGGCRGSSPSMLSHPYRLRWHEEAHHAPPQVGHTRKKLDGPIRDAPLHASSPPPMAVFRSSPVALARLVPPASLLCATSALACPSCASTLRCFPPSCACPSMETEPRPRGSPEPVRLARNCYLVGPPSLFAPTLLLVPAVLPSLLLLSLLLSHSLLCSRSPLVYHVTACCCPAAGCRLLPAAVEW